MAFAAKGAPARTSIITPMLMPDADASLRSFFFGKDHTVRKVSKKHLRKWSEKAAIPKPVDVPGLGCVVSKRGSPLRDGSRPLVREIRSATSRVRTVPNGVVRETLITTAVFGEKPMPKFERTQSHLKVTCPREYNTIPLRALTIDVDNEAMNPPKEPSAVTVEKVEEEIADYSRSVDRIAIPPGFVRLPDTERLNKRQVQQMYEEAGYTGMEYRSLFQPTVTTKDPKTGKVTRAPGPYYVGCIDYDERVKRRIKPIPRPKSAPVNIIPAQRVSRERLSVPAQFRRLGASYVGKTKEEVQRAFPGRRVFKQMKTLPGEAHQESKIIMSQEEIEMCKDDTEIWEWVVQRAPKRNAYDPDGDLYLPRSTLFQPKRLLPDPDSLRPTDREEYIDEKMKFLGTPKTRWDEKHVTAYGRDEDDKLLTVKIATVNKELEEVRAEIKQRLLNKGMKEESKFATKNPRHGRKGRKRATAGASVLKYNLINR